MIKTQTFIFDFMDNEARLITISKHNELVDILNDKGIQWKVMEFFKKDKYRVCIFIWEE